MNNLTTRHPVTLLISFFVIAALFVLLALRSAEPAVSGVPGVQTSPAVPTDSADCRSPSDPAEPSSHSIPAPGTIATPDTIPVTDTIAVSDTISMADTVATSDTIASFLPEVFTSPSGDRMNYRIRQNRPDEHDGPLPLLLFLHGAGERGDENIRQLIHLAPLFDEDGPLKDKPAIVVAPQCPAERYWVDIGMREFLGSGQVEKVYELLDQPPTREMELVLELLDSLSAAGGVDPARMYVMGLSMGGFGSFDLLSRRPGTFAAAIPICGGGHPGHSDRHADKTVIWLTHGADDTVVPPEFSRNSYQALKEAGADVRYTEFPNTNHNAWSPTFAIPGIFEWMFEQKVEQNIE